MARGRPAARATQEQVELRSPEEVALLRAAGRTVAQILKRCQSACLPGVTTKALDEIAEVAIRRAGCEPLFVGQPSHKKHAGPFPAVLCVSVNEEVVHGIPAGRKLQPGDLVSVDCGIRRHGWCGDTAWTFAVGGLEALPAAHRELMRVGQAALELGVSECRPGRRWSAIAARMADLVHAAGFGVVREFVGHGIGRTLHERPQVPNYCDEDTLARSDFELEPGLVFCIEPMVTLGDPETRTARDGWTVVTRDRSPAVHFEHMVAITADGAEVLTAGGPGGPAVE